MIKFVEVPVENELDLSLSYRKSMKAGELVRISVSMRTAFATAISEVCRELIDKTTEGMLCISAVMESQRYFLLATLHYKQSIGVDSLYEGLSYASKLVPEFSHQVKDGKGYIALKVKIPLTANVSEIKLLKIRDYFANTALTTPYEELRKKNLELFKINEESTIALRTAEYIIEQKNEFLSVASHELKTPMTILRAFTQIALKNVDSAQMPHYLEKIDIQAKKMQNMISQLLDISKSEINQRDYYFEEMEINTYLEELEELIKSLIPSHQFRFIRCETSVSLLFDRLKLEQVINNLVINAAKYSALQSEITLQVNRVGAEEVILSVHDEGIGMSDVDLHHVFEKFYRVSEVSQRVPGLGVGLYLSSMIVADHGGKIWAESQPGVGSVFYVSLPLRRR